METLLRATPDDLLVVSGHEDRYNDEWAECVVVHSDGRTRDLGGTDPYKVFERLAAAVDPSSEPVIGPDEVWGAWVITTVGGHHCLLYRRLQGDVLSLTWRDFDRPGRTLLGEHRLDRAMRAEWHKALLAAGDASVKPPD